MTERAAGTGPRLKAERERRGLSSQKAADELHLDGWVIDALEAENYERIGPSVYAKGHLKRYATLLGLPADEIMAGYESRAQAPEPEPVQTPNVRLRTDAPVVSDLPWPRIAGSVALLLLILGVLWWKPWHQRSAAVNASTASASGAAESPAAGSAPAEAPAISPSSSPPPAGLIPTSLASSTAPAQTPAALPGAGTASGAGAEAEAAAGMGRAHLRMSFSADSWVDIHDAAGRRVFAGNGRANSVKTVAGIAPMRVYLGVASGVQLEINDRAVAIGPQFMAGDVARFVAGADGVLRRDSRAAAAAATPAPIARPSD
ncbi:MAG TPA: helix-turn-helix domain-containing protein [Steroidobacteraceae bacterium]|nr:helix-turn-helix domain-containing protein [Steroidobacteraceae bacterium]